MLRGIRDFFRAATGSFGTILANYAAVRAITVACIAVYLAQWLASFIVVPFYGRGARLDILMSYYLGMFWPLFSHGCVWQPLTYIFLHGSLWHLLLNLFSLVFLGYAVENLLGSRRFWQIFLVSAVAGGIGWMLFDIVEPRMWYAVARAGRVGLALAQRWGEAQGGSFNVCVGASGGVFGIMGAFVALRPRERISMLLFYVFPVSMQAWQMALLLVAFNLFEMVTSMGHIAYMAHLLGGAVGYFMARRFMRRREVWTNYYA